MATRFARNRKNLPYRQKYPTVTGLRVSSLAWNPLGYFEGRVSQQWPAGVLQLLVGAVASLAGGAPFVASANVTGPDSFRVDAEVGPDPGQFLGPSLIWLINDDGFSRALPFLVDGTPMPATVL